MRYSRCILHHPSPKAASREVQLSERPARYGTPVRTLTDDDWTAHYTLIEGRMAIVVEQRSLDGDAVACVPLTPHRARLLRRLLAEMLDEAGVAIGDMMIREGTSDKEPP